MPANLARQTRHAILVADERLRLVAWFGLHYHVGPSRGPSTEYAVADSACRLWAGPSGGGPARTSAPRGSARLVAIGDFWWAAHNVRGTATGIRPCIDLTPLVLVISTWVILGTPTLARIGLPLPRPRRLMREAQSPVWLSIPSLLLQKRRVAPRSEGRRRRLSPAQPRPPEAWQKSTPLSETVGGHSGTRMRERQPARTRTRPPRAILTSEMCGLNTHRGWGGTPSSDAAASPAVEQYPPHPARKVVTIAQEGNN
jgi:hypothetical protein